MLPQRPKYSIPAAFPDRQLLGCYQHLAQTDRSAQQGRGADSRLCREEQRP